MASKKKEVQLQTLISDQEQWDEMLQTKGITVVEVYQAWCGPSKAAQSLFRKLKIELGDEYLHLAMADADSLRVLGAFKGKCEPAFIFCSGGQITSVVRGVNAPVLQKLVMEKIEEEKKILEGSIKRPQVPEKLILNETATVINGALPDPVKPDAADQTQKEPFDDSCTLTIIKPDAVLNGKVEEIKQKIKEAGMTIVADAQRTLTEEQARDFYHHEMQQPNFEDLVKLMSSGPCHALIISKVKGAASISDLKELIGPASLETTKILEPNSLKDIQLSNVTDSREQASRELAFFFPTFGKAQAKADESAPESVEVESTVALIRPAILREKRDAILQKIQEAGFTIAMQKEVVLTEEQAKEFYKEHEGKEFFETLVRYMTSGPVLALALTREHAVQAWRDLLGPKILQEAKENAPNSLRAQFAVDAIPINQLHGSSSPESAWKELGFFFPVQQTLAVIKPDAVPEHKGEVLKKIKEAGFTILNMKEIELNREMAVELYKEQKEKPFFDDLVDSMSRGPSVLMVLTKENAIEEWRKLMGPTDPQKAKETEPHSLRAQFAKSILQNALHGSSNVEHAMRNIKFIFGDFSVDPSGKITANSEESKTDPHT